MMLVQIAPEIGPGTGVGTVAYELEREWLARGHDVRRFTLREAHGGWLPKPGRGAVGKLALLLRVVWFSTVGTVLARRYLHQLGDPPSVCHNDALAGDVYINHGLLATAMRARGGYAWRMARNPMHLFILLRDRHRYASGRHAVVVNLVTAEEAALRREYPRLSSRTVVIGNGVDTARFTPATAEGRAGVRAGLGLSDDQVALLFVGHEFGRKGLPVVLAALRELPSDVHLVVVGGTADMVRDLERSAEEAGLSTRVHAVGAKPDPRPYFGAADLFVLPTAYESYGLVITEALACGVPVVVPPVGCVPDVVTDPRAGAVVPPQPHDVALGVARLLAAGVRAPSPAARDAAEQHTWSAVAERYLEVLAEQRRARTAEAAT